MSQLDSSPRNLVQAPDLLSGSTCSLVLRKKVAMFENQEIMIPNSHSQKQGHPAGVCQAGASGRPAVFPAPISSILP